MSFPKNLQAALDARKWTAAHLAAAMSDAGHPCSVAAIALWLVGARCPRLETLQVMARVLNTTPNDLLQFEADAFDVDAEPDAEAPDLPRASNE